jgi:uncharacterized repeat protein (TIGR03803 family)
MKTFLLRISALAFSAAAFILPITAHAQYTETVLYNFGTSSADAETPEGVLTMDASGNVYGAGRNAVFELSPDNGAYTDTVLHIFTGTNGDGEFPNGRMVFDASGNIYGSTGRGGANGDGTIFELSPNGSGGYNETILYNFAGSTDGEFPTGGLIADSAGNLYGTAARGGANGLGTVFEISNSNGWQEKTLYSFTGSTDGSLPQSIISDAAGNLYGIAFDGGSTSCTCGTVFKLLMSAGWRFSVIHQFNQSNGAYPEGSLTFDSAGNLYGGTLEGGVDGHGVVYELSPDANGIWTTSILHSFTVGYDGAGVVGPVTIDSSGNVYGTTITGTQTAYGTAFELSPVSGGGWQFIRLHGFTGGLDGGSPQSTLFVDASGNVFGAAPDGGTNNFGVYFELSLPATNVNR